MFCLWRITGRSKHERHHQQREQATPGNSSTLAAEQEAEMRNGAACAAAAPGAQQQNAAGRINIWRNNVVEGGLARRTRPDQMPGDPRPFLSVQQPSGFCSSTLASSDLPSPSETCYGLFRRALQVSYIELKERKNNKINTNEKIGAYFHLERRESKPKA
jgi:hypothetical protein